MEDKQAQLAEDTASVMPTEEIPTESEEDAQSPDRDRTAEQFEKLKEHNKQLKDELEALKNPKPTQSVLESLRPSDNFPNVSQEQAQHVADQLFDENGFVDPSLLNQKLAQAEKTAKEAIQAAQQAQQQLRNFEETQQTQQLYAKYPQLDPNGDKFDPKFYKKVRNELIGQMMEGKQNAMQAADAVWQDDYATKEVQEKANEDASLKQQASSNLGTSQGASAPVDYDWLVEQTRKGNSDALAERLKRAGY